MYAWNFAPTLVLGLLLQPIVYALITGPLRQHFPGSAPVPRGATQAFYLGSAVLFVALISPIDTLGAVSLTMHMVQHLLLTLVAAPLFVIGTPSWLFRPLLKLPYVLPVARFLTGPIPAFLIYNAVFTIWHVPAFYDLALRNQPIHILEHLTMLGTALLTWWPVFSPMEELPALSDPLKCLYLFFQALPPTILGALITFASSVIYPTYANTPHVFGFSAMVDQQLGGLIMWVPGGLVFFVVLTVILIRYLNRDEYEPDEPIPSPLHKGV